MCILTDFLESILEKYTYKCVGHTHKRMFTATL